MLNRQRAVALLSGVSFVVPSHVTRIIPALLAHRARVASTVSVHDILEDVMENEPAPF
jgi:MoxR-like ATPase